MHKISIISASVRTGRKSHRVALYLKQFLGKHPDVETEIIDLKAYQFPIFDERLKNMSDPDPQAVEFAKKIKKSDAVIIVTPEYNGGYPASLKNVTDLLIDEWYRKPIAFAPVSAGAFAGTQVITSIQFSYWKMRALLVPAVFHTATIDKSFDENGTPSDPEKTDERAKKFVDEILWVADKLKNRE